MTALRGGAFLETSRGRRVFPGTGMALFRFSDNLKDAGGTPHATADGALGGGHGSATAA